MNENKKLWNALLTGGVGGVLYSGYPVGNWLLPVVLGANCWGFTRYPVFRPNLREEYESWALNVDEDV